MIAFLEKPSILSKGVYLQIPVRITLLDETIIRSNEPEEVLTYKYKNLGNRFIIPWRKIKGKLRRLVLEKQRYYNIEPNCSLKDDLCMQCPTCLLFGGTGETSSNKADYNILSRVYGETFISEQPAEEITPYTANAVSEKDLTTGQALMSILTVPKETSFLGVVTIKDPTVEMASIIVENLKRLTRLGARSVEWGRVQTEILDYHLSDREDLSAYLALNNDNGAFKCSGLPKGVNLSTVNKNTYSNLDKETKCLISSITKEKNKKKGT